MELQNFGPIAQAGDKLHSNKSSDCLTSALIGIGAGILIGYMIYSWQQQQMESFKHYSN